VLSAIDIASMQAVMLNAMDMTLSIDRPTNATGAWFQTIESFTPIATSVKCLVSDPSDGEMNEQGQSGIVGVQQQWDIWVPNGTNVQINDRVTLSNGLVLRVQSTHDPRTTYFMLDSFLASVVR
jgi:hypothetical protein